MSRYRLFPTPAQQTMLRGHCAHARYVWNIAVEQHSHWRPGRAGAPGYLEQCRQLTQARAEHAWLAAGSQTVQQQALRDFAQAMVAFFDPGNSARRPTWRKAGRDEGFGIVGTRGQQWDMRRLSRKVGEAVGIDRGVAVSAALSTGELLHVPGLMAREQRRMLSLARKLARARRGVEKIKAAFTSQRCSACGYVDAESRESQARFACTACGFACHADLNAARNIAAGHAVTARGGYRDTGPANREPQLLASFAGRE